MKLLRVGKLGKETVAVLDSNNKIRDLTGYIEDLNPFYGLPLKKLHWLMQK